MTDHTPFLAQAKALLGPKGFTTDSDLVSPWLTDWRGRYTGRSLGLASPANTQEVAQLVSLCAQHAVPIVPQGGNSGMSGGATPDESGEAIILSLRRMNTVRAFSTESRTITCDAGLILQTLHDHAEAQGLRFPLTLGGKGSATIGGLISTNAGGTQVLRHGTMRAQVVGVEAVLADGQIFDSLVPLKKDNRGFDLKQLLIGSEGTLGIVTAATLKLVPKTFDRIVLWVGLDSILDARNLLLQCDASNGDALEGFEVLPRHCLEAVLAHLPDARNPLAEVYPWQALIEIVANTAEEAERLPEIAQTILEKAFDGGLIADGTYSTSDTQAESFWLLRDSISAAERALGPAMQHDISVPVEQMAAFVETAIPQVEAAFPDCVAAAFGHLGDGNVHFHVLAPPGSARGKWETDAGKKISMLVHDLVTQWGGSISAEHGIGQMKLDELGRLGDPVSLTIMRNVKAALDPLGILNPGKLVPPPQAG